MSPFVWLVIGAIVIVVALAIAWSANRSSDVELSAFRIEMQNTIAAQAQSVTAQMNHLVQTLTEQLGQVRQELNSGVASSGKLASDSQAAIAQQLQNSNEAIRRISQQLGEVQQAGRDLSQTTQTLQTILGGAKTRGILGEVALERLLEDALPQSAYEIQFRFPSTGTIVDAIVRTGERLLPIDSKFPLESYRRLLENGDDSRREFSQAVRKHADSIAEKYILPAERTMDYALMFVPSEGIYYELLMTDDAKNGKLDEYCRSKRVFPVSPNTIYVCLSAVAVSLKEQRVAENARHLLACLSGLTKQLDTVAEVHDRLGNHLRHSQQTYEDLTSKFDRARNFLEQMSQGTLPLPEEAPQTLFPISRE
jgi:DNA recombination protein RmuC